MTRLMNHDCLSLAEKMADAILEKHGTRRLVRLYGVPRGGVPVAYLLLAVRQHRFSIESSPIGADVIVDDLVDSGKTKAEWTHNTKLPFYALLDYWESPKNDWIVFPWEESSSESSEEDIVRRLLQYIGEDPEREGLLETPKRVLKGWKHWCSGYNKKPADVLKVFKDGSEKYNEMIVESPIPFYSHCEHHLAPFFGTATIGYIPDQLGVCGLSKIPRILDIYARRLQVQERLTVQTADALMSLLQPKGVGVVIKARHMCMESRGVGIQGVYTTTSALRGNFLDNEKVRQEFLHFVK